MKMIISRLLAPTFAVAILATVRPSVARGLKAFRAPEASAPLSDKLEAENEALKQQNTQLEAMFKVAQAEEQRANVAFDSRNQEQEVDTSEALKEEIAELRKKLNLVQADKSNLVQTVQRMLGKNSTEIFEKQAAKAQLKLANLARRCGNEQQHLSSEKKQANGKLGKMKEITQNLQDQNIRLQRALEDTRSQLAKSAEMSKQLSLDKENIVSGVQASMRESSKLKKDLKAEIGKEKKTEQELEHEKAILASLRKQSKVAAKRIDAMLKPKHKPPKVDAKQQAVKEAAAAKALAHELTATKSGQDLSSWLGMRPKTAAAGAIRKDKDGMSPIDALDPDMVNQEKQKKKSDSNAGGDDIDSLLKQAKDQLAAMDSVSDEDVVDVEKSYDAARSP